MPDASEEPVTPAAYGWVVEPQAIWIEGRLLALAGDQGAPAGHFAGEADLAALKAQYYTVNGIPADADPAEVIRIFAAAIKEKNYDLYRQAVDPSWTVTATAESRLRYYWDNNQERFRTLYVHVEPTQVDEPIVLSGERIDDLEAAFLTAAEQAALVERAGPLEEQVTVWVTRFDERGLQVGSPNPIRLRRQGEGRWLVYSGFPL